MKRFLSILLTLTLLASMFTFATYANELGTIAFYNAEDNSVATQLDGVDKLYANVTFTASKTGTASVMVAHYDIETGKLEKMESIDSVSMTAGVVATFTTSAISVADTDLLKVFAWDEATLAPLTNVGTIERDLLEELPTATVTAISTDADFALNFKADEVTDEQLAFYGDWEADFVFTTNKDAIFNQDGSKDGYLIGQYDEFGPEFVKVPATDFAITAGTPVSIMDAAGLNVTYRDVVETVKDFDCGVDYADAYLKANDGLEVSIALVLVNPENGNTYTIAEKAFDFNMPTATVTEIDVAEADFALNFKADEATESQVATFGDWKADFVFTTNKDATFNANGTKDGYLVGQYDEFGPEFVKVPAADVTVAAGVPVNVLGSAGMNVTYRDVVETIKDFDCGVNFADSYLKANDGLEVSLALVIVNPVTGEAYTIAEKAFDFTMPTATVTDIKVAEADFALNFKADEATESQVATFGDWKADFVFTTNKDATFNANGTKDGYLVGQYDEFGPEFVSIPAADYTVKAGVPVNVLATAGMNVTYKDVVETVKDFDCGVNFADSYLKANDGLEVSLALVIVNPVTDEAYTIAEKSFSWTLPTAEVTHLDTTKLDVEADFAMNFKANEATESQLATFGDWAADYVVTFNKNATFNANGEKDGYLLGQYDEFGAEWVKLPATDLAITAGAPVKVLETAGMSATYRDVVETIKDFDCGINFSKEFLAANDGVSATVELRIYNPLNPAESYVIGDAITRTWKQPTATVTELDVEAIEGVDLDFALNFKADESTQEQLLMFGDWYADYELTVNKTATFNANGNADGFLSGQYDAWSKNWVSVPFEDATLQANTPVRVMETAAALMGQSGLKLTYADIVNSVKDFNCGLAFTPEFLVANPDLEVTLALKMYNPNNENESYVVGRTYTFTPKTIPSIDKFIGNDVTYTHTLETVEANTVTYDFADLFTVIGGVPVKMEDITVTGATYADGKITVEGFGTKTITVTDNYYCNTATATVTVNAPASVDKWTATNKTVDLTVNTAGQDQTFTVAELFTAIEGANIKNATITVEGGNFINGQVVVPGTAGTYTVTITDNFYCNAATATITVNDAANVDKFVGKDIEVTHTLDTIESNVYTVDFADLFDTNDEYVVKDITVTGATYADGKVTVEGLGTITVTATDNFYCNEATATITVNEPANVDKFTGKAVTLTHTLFTIEDGVVTATLEELFTNNGYTVKEVTVGGDGTYADGKVSFAGTGTFYVTITDNFYCNTATATVVVNAPVAMDKFTGKAVTYTHTLDTIEANTVTYNFADLFDTVEGANVKAEDITVEGATYADGKITVTGLGTITVTATDNFYCNIATATVTVNAPANVNKFTATNKTIDLTVNTVGQDQTVNFEDLFTAVEGVVIKAISVTVDNGASFADGVVTVPGKAGTYTVTATDNFYCNPVTATITVKDAASVDKFTGKAVTYTHTLDTIEANTVTYNFADLFDTNTEYVVKDITVEGATYADGKITVTGIGTFTITATDNFYCNEATATVTVKEPANVDKWTATNKTVDLTVNTVGQDQTVNFEDLFTAVEGAIIKDATVTVNNGGSYANNVITIPGKAGTYTVTVTDNFYCNAATATITVKDVANVDKFTGKAVTYTHTLDTIEANTVTYNFADLFDTNTEYVVKDITVEGATYADGKITVTGIGTFTITATDNYYCNKATATVTVKEPANVDKWTGKTVSKKLAYGSNTVTATLDELFTDNGYVKGTITVGGDGAYANNVVTFTGAGTYKVTITDNYYCNTATATVTVADADPINKFTAKNPSVTHTLASIDEKAVSVKLGDIFSGTNVVTGNITVTIAGKATTVSAADWANATVTIPGTTGDVTVTITDNYYCNTATGKVTLTAPANQTKWTATNKTVNLTVNTVGQNQTFNFADLFTAVNGAYIKAATVTVNNGGSYASNKVTVPGKAGTYTVTVTDNFYCNAATATITVNDAANVDKFT
ncbi:MAG: hypothetical protein E7413_01010, partial [Ruminococcaceae bacterium]|nr:hypothetical protein [Oscillospiraceae bacterium]